MHSGPRSRPLAFPGQRSAEAWRAQIEQAKAAKANWLVGPDPNPAPAADAELNGRAAALGCLLLLTLLAGILFGVLGHLLWQGRQPRPLSLPDSPPAVVAPAHEAFEL